MEKITLKYFEDLKESQQKKLEKTFKKVEHLSFTVVAINRFFSAGFGSYYYKGTLKNQYNNLTALEIAMICNESFIFQGGWSKVNSETGEFEVML